MLTEAEILQEERPDDNLVAVEDLYMWFPIHGGVLSRVVNRVRAVDGVSFTIKKGETLGLVGESGCGKTTLGRAILRLVEPNSGKIMFDGVDFLKLSKKQLQKTRRDMQIVFQDPFSSLSPRMTVESIVGEPLTIHRMASGKQYRERVAELLQVVGLQPHHARRLPHEFSGGQRQRIGIAKALALNPKFIVCDEPVSALDVSIRSQILNLLKKLQSQFNLTYLFISHDLAVVEYLCDRVCVMYLGKIVEMASRDSLFDQPVHPYTESLLSAIPVPDPKIKKKRILLKGDVPSPIDPPKGCRFHTRCWLAEEICSREEPPLVDKGGGHYAACHLR